MTLRKKFLILALLLAWFGRDGVRAQTTVDLRPVGCDNSASSGIRFVAMMPTPVPGTTLTVSTPVCLTLEALKSFLGVTAPATVQVPRFVLEKTALTPNIAPTQTTFTYNLLKKPVPDSVIFIIHHSSYFGQDRTEVVMPAKTPDGQAAQQMSITLPTYRPFVATLDTITFVYWTLDPP